MALDLDKIAAAEPLCELSDSANVLECGGFFIEQNRRGAWFNAYAMKLTPERVKTLRAVLDAVEAQIGATDGA
jgi:hypothetical protein